MPSPPTDSILSQPTKEQTLPDASAAASDTPDKAAMSDSILLRSESDREVAKKDIVVDEKNTEITTNSKTAEASSCPSPDSDKISQDKAAAAADSTERKRDAAPEESSTIDPPASKRPRTSTASELDAQQTITTAVVAIETTAPISDTVDEKSIHDDPDAAATAAAAKHGKESELVDAACAGETSTISNASVISFQWLDEGVVGKDGNRYHNLVQLSSRGKSFVVRTGDAVFVYSTTSVEQQTTTQQQQQQQHLNGNSSGQNGIITQQQNIMMDWKNHWLCRVEKLWESPDDDDDDAADDRPVEWNERVHFTARWFFRNGEELRHLPGEWQGRLSRQDLIDILDQANANTGPNHVVLSNQLDDNDISSIQGPCNLVYFPKELKTVAAKNEFLQEEERRLGQVGRGNQPLFACEHRLDIDSEKPVLKFSYYYQSDFDDEHTRGNPLNDEPPGKQAGILSNNETLGSISSDEDEDDDDDSESSNDKIPVKVPVEGEGSNLRGDIEVGENHQAEVGPFIPGQSVRSRNPTLVWKPHAISEDDLQAFLEKLAVVHTQYLKRNALTMEEPYSPLPADKMEDMMRQTPGRKLTGSSLSTASMLGTSRTTFLKECNADEVLKLLHDHNYDADAALATATAKDSKTNAQLCMAEVLSTGWSKVQRDIFNDGFRRTQGSIRSIAKAIAPTKTMKDVIDYHYRFKIPDQYRRYQDKKREQAIRMVECIEKRRFYDPSSYSNLPSGAPQSTALSGNVASADGRNLLSENNSESGDRDTSKQQNRKLKKHWSETGVMEVTDAVEERRRAAKELLLDVQRILGKEIMVEVAAIVKELHQSYDVQTKDALFALLKGQLELQNRFLEFLPKHF